MFEFEDAPLLESGKHWKWKLLAQYLLTTTLLKLASTGIELDRETSDQVGWLNARVDRFSDSSAYMLKTGWNLDNNWIDWKLIWRLSVAQCVKVFFWQLTPN